MTAPDALSEKHPETGKATGSWSLGRILAAFWTLLATVPPATYYLQAGPEQSVWQMLAVSFAFGVLAVGFKRGLGAGAFQKVVDALTSRVKG